MNVDEALATVRVVGRPPAANEVSMLVAQTLADEVERQRGAVAHVRELHRPDPWGDCPTCAPDPEGDDLPYPCPTMRVLESEV